MVVRYYQQKELVNANQGFHCSSCPGDPIIRTTAEME